MISKNSDERRAARANVLLMAEVEWEGGVFAARLSNLSPLGALVVGDDLPPENTEVLFRRNDLRVRGVVAWVQGNFAGIEFHEPLDPKDVLRNIPKPVSAPKVMPDARRPGVQAKRLTDWERRIGEQWANMSPSKPRD